MKKGAMVSLLVGLCLLASIFATPILAQVPLPHAFYGSLEVNGSPANPGYQVEAIVEGVSPGEGNPIITTELGKYGGPGGLDPKLVVQGDIEPGTILTFYVDGERAQCREAGTEVWEDSYPWQSGEVTELDLSATITRPRGGGGGGGAPRDTTPPQISNILLCPEGVTETTADICWITDERSTSQVEYWTSPSMLSPLDETMIASHHVQLTGLIPGTTYYYKTMSEDAAGNLAISDEHTFTTLGEAPAATFTSCCLNIFPSEVDIGEKVSIRVTANNKGNAAGSYEVTLKINGTVEATKEVTLDAGASEKVTFTTSKDVAGSYSVDVNGLSGSFTVKEELAPPTAPPEEAPPEVKPPINWPVIGGIIAGVVIVGLLIFFVVRRRAY